MTDARSLIVSAAEATLAIRDSRREAREHEDRSRAARLQERELRHELAEAVRHLINPPHELKRVDVSRLLVDELRERGLTDAEIDGLGVSKFSVGRMVR